MRSIFCSIGKSHIVADVRVDGNRSIDFFDDAYHYPTELQEKLSQVVQRLESTDRLYLTATFEPAYFLRIQDIDVFREGNSKEFLYRTMPLSEYSAIAYSIPPEISAFIRDLDYPVYYLPTLEILSRNFDPSDDYWDKWKAISLIYLIDEYLYIIFINKENETTSAVFKCENASDILYYTLLVAEQKSVKSESLLAIIGGRGKWLPEAERLIHKFFQSPPSFFSTSDHKHYFDLKGLMKCEL